MIEKIRNRISRSGADLYIKASDAADRFDRNNKLNIALICVICAAAFLMAFFFNSLTHLAADDYAYNFIFIEEGIEEANGFNTGERLSSLSDIFDSMKAHYNTVNGRVVVHFIVQLMMLLGKPFFNVVNSAVFVLLILLMYFHCKGTSKRQSAVLFAMLGLAVWSFAPGLGVTVFWLDGSVNYMWGSVMRLVALLPFRFYFDNGDSKKPVLMALPSLLLSFLAGAANENTSAAFVGMVVLYIILFRLRGFRIPDWSITGLIGGIAGYLFMSLAPGTGVRLDTWGGGSLVMRAVVLAANIIDKLLPFAAAAMLAAVVLYAVQKKDKLNFILPFLYMLGALAGALVMIVSHYFPDRAWFGIIMLAIISVGMLVYQLSLCDKKAVRQCVVLLVQLMMQLLSMLSLMRGKRISWNRWRRVITI